MLTHFTSTAYVITIKSRESKSKRRTGIVDSPGIIVSASYCVFFFFLCPTAYSYFFKGSYYYKMDENFRIVKVGEVKTDWLHC